VPDRGESLAHRLLARPKAIRSRGSQWALVVAALTALAAVFWGEFATNPSTTVGSMSLLVVLSTSWLLPTPKATLVAAAASMVPLAAAQLGGLDELTSRFQWFAVVTLGVSVRLAVRAIERGDALRLRLQEQLLAAERRRAAEAERSSASLQRFTADAAHELRAPLATVRAELEVALTRPRSAEDYRQALQTSLAELERLGTLADSLLLLARADSGTLLPQVASMDLADLLELHLDRWRSLALKQEVTLAGDIPDTGTMDGDPILLGRLVDNLIDNALRHAPPGGTVTLRGALEGAEWVVEVSDDGPGVDPDLIPVLFDRFTRSDRARSRGSGGAGLGLSLCRSIAEAHGGSITLAPGATGSRFVVRLPRGRSASVQNSGPQSRTPAGDTVAAVEEMRVPPGKMAPALDGPER
jgi:signal transduction histidine kinase